MDTYVLDEPTRILNASKLKATSILGNMKFSINLCEHRSIGAIHGVVLMEGTLLPVYRAVANHGADCVGSVDIDLSGEVQLLLEGA